jgi:putative flippase GtrA
MINNYYIKENFNKIILFIFVGVVTFTFNFISFIIINDYFENTFISVTISWLLTTMLHYILNRIITFKYKSSLIISSTRYSVMIIFNYLIVVSVTFIYDHIDLLPTKYLIIFTSLSTALSSFLTMNHFVFKDKK